MPRTKLFCMKHVYKFGDILKTERKLLSKVLWNVHVYAKCFEIDLKNIYPWYNYCKNFILYIFLKTIGKCLKNHYNKCNLIQYTTITISENYALDRLNFNQKSQFSWTYNISNAKTCQKCKKLLRENPFWQPLGISSWNSWEILYNTILITLNF